jgi:hypothetical protein
MNRVTVETPYPLETAPAHLHIHEFVEISMVVAGKGIHQTMLQTTECSVGDVFIINEDTPHVYFALPDGERPTVCNVIFDPKDLFEGAYGNPENSKYCYNVFQTNNLFAYVKLDEIPITPDSPRVGMITASSLCIRKGPGTGNAIVGTYLRGDMVTIFETVKVGGIRWGRTAKGWICMDYVQLTASTGGFSEVETTVPVTETENPGDETVETPGTEATEAVPAFDFTYEEFVSALNTQLEECDAVAKRVNSEKENILCYEFTALSDEESYGVIMYIEVAENGRNIAAAAMVCNAENEVVCENLAIFATFAMLTADETITEEQLEKMLSESKVDDDGNQYYIMERESGQYIFVIADNLLQFHMRPVSE